MAFALYGITAVLAPTIGPMLGGWITDNYSWRWIFFIKIPVAVLAVYLTYTLVEDPPFLRRVKGAGIRVDYIGIAMLTLGVGSLQILLDKGQEATGLGRTSSRFSQSPPEYLITLIIWEWFRKDPIIDVRLFKNLNFGAANLMMFMMGIMLFSTLVMIPEFLQTLMGFTAELAGLVLSASGLVLLLMMPIVGRLTTKVQSRYLIAAGWLALACGLYYSAYRTDLLISFRFAMWLRVVQVIGIGFLFVPITMAGYIGVPAEKGNSVSGLVNFMRNIGSSIGTSIVTTMIARRAQYHQQILVGHVTGEAPAFRSAFVQLTSRLAHAGMTSHDARRHAMALLYRQVNRQAHTMAYIDTFWILAVLSAIMFVLAFFLKKNDPTANTDVPVG